MQSARFKVPSISLGLVLNIQIVIYQITRSKLKLSRSLRRIVWVFQNVRCHWCGSFDLWLFSQTKMWVGRILRVPSIHFSLNFPTGSRVYRSEWINRCESPIDFWQPKIHIHIKMSLSVLFLILFIIAGRLIEILQSLCGGIWNFFLFFSLNWLIIIFAVHIVRSFVNVEVLFGLGPDIWGLTLVIYGIWCQS